MNAMTPTEIMHLLGNPDFVLTAGTPGSTKSSFAVALSDYTRINNDLCRLKLYGDEAKLGDPKQVYGMMMGQLRVALDRGDRIIVDNTNLTRSTRRSLVKKGRESGRVPLILVFDVSLEQCLKWNALRARKVPVEVLTEMAADMFASGPPPASEAEYRGVRPSAEIGKYFLLDRDTPLVVYSEPVLPSLSIDVVGDVHGCFEELLTLMNLLGWQVTVTGVTEDGLPAYDFVAPANRMLGFVGDLVDRGPASDLVLNLVEQLHRAKLALLVQGNHDNKLYRKLKGNNVKVGVALTETLRQIHQHGPQFAARVLQFLQALPYKVGTEDLIIVHAAYRRGVSKNRFQSLAIYGDVDGSQHEDGRPVRSDLWEAEYEGKKDIVHGHIALPEVTRNVRPSGATIWNVDTSAVFGGKLTALRFPERELISVPSTRMHSDPHTSHH